MEDLPVEFRLTLDLNDKRRSEEMLTDSRKCKYLQVSEVRAIRDKMKLQTKSESGEMKEKKNITQRKKNHPEKINFEQKIERRWARITHSFPSRSSVNPITVKKKGVHIQKKLNAPITRSKIRKMNYATSLQMYTWAHEIQVDANKASNGSAVFQNAQA